MIQNEVAIGRNRTGIDLSPTKKRELVEGAATTIPSTEGDQTTMMAMRAEYAERGEPVGSLAPPATIKGAAGAAVDMLKGKNMAVFFDKLSERLAFERTGTRLYEALLQKHAASEPLVGGPSAEDLSRLGKQELAHFDTVQDVIVTLGGDPTSISPSADVAAVASNGILQVIGDPRTTLKQSLEAMLIAELIDNDCWVTLIQIARNLGHEDIAVRFERALTEEDEHLASIRAWISASTLLEEERPGAPIKAAVQANKNKKNG